MTSTFAAAIVGPAVDAVLGENQTATVAGRYARALHFKIGDHLVCIGGPGIGNGPCNALMANDAEWSRLSWAAEGLDTWEFTAHRLVGAHVVIEFGGAERWRQPAWPAVASFLSVCGSISELRSLIMAHAPAEGLSRLITAGVLDDPVARAASPHLRELRSYLGDDSGYRSPPVDLLGLGPGSTPSGDDVLAGVLLALSATGWTTIRDSLGLAIAEAAPRRTTFLSTALLAQASSGQAGEDIVRAVSAIVAGDTHTLATHALAAGRHGATSGWDTLAGVWFAIEAVTAAR